MALLAPMGVGLAFSFFFWWQQKISFLFRPVYCFLCVCGVLSSFLLVFSPCSLLHQHGPKPSLYSSTLQEAPPLCLNPHRDPHTGTICEGGLHHQLPPGISSSVLRTTHIFYNLYIPTLSTPVQLYLPVKQFVHRDIECTCIKLWEYNSKKKKKKKLTASQKRVQTC